MLRNYIRSSIFFSDPDLNRSYTDDEHSASLWYARDISDALER